VSRPLAPNPKGPHPYVSTITAPVSSLHTGPKFVDGRQHRFFGTYLEIAAEIRGPYSSSLWERLIPQSCHAESYIWHAVIAVGAMSKTLRDMRVRSEGTRGLLCENTNYIYALKEYDKALRGMREVISKGGGDVRSALLACFLFFCFENMSGRPGAAAANAISGLMVLHHGLTKMENPHIPPRRSNARTQRCGVEYNLEDDVMAAVLGLDLHIVFFVDPRSEAFHQFYIEGFDTAVAEMPEEIPSLESARHFWQIIMSRNNHFIRKVLNAGQAVENKKPSDHDKDGPWEDGTNLSPRINIFFTFKKPPMDVFPDVLRYREDIRRWKRASAPILDHLWKTGTQQEKTAACLLQIHALMAHIILAGTFCTTETAFDQFLPEYQKIMELVKCVYPHLVEANDGEPVYRFGLGIIIAMFLVGVRCRHKATRESAAHLLNLNKEYREGMWDSGSAGTIVNLLREIEDGMRDENGEIAEEDRAFVTEAHLDIPYRRGIIKVAQKSRAGVRFREQVISW
jgi:hypothetical protein